MEVSVKKILAGAVGGAAVFAAVFGAGTANAVDEYKGLTYEQAAESINGGGGSAVISSRVGEYLPTDKCIVSGSRRANFRDSSGNATGGTVLLDLNCTDTMTAGHPGYSVTSPQGQKAKQLKDSVTYINQDFAKATEAGQPSWCEENADSCVRICQKDGAACSEEVLGFLGI